MLQRAYSTLELKSVDDDKRIIEGIASTPSTDRMGDIVEPKGAEFKLPIPLLWQHRSGEPIGNVIAATVTSAGIKIRAQFAKIEEPGRLKDRLDEAWQSVKAGLVRGLSIGFDPIESARIEGTFGFRFMKWEWLELSAVTIPANADASITAIKHYDAPFLAATGTEDRSASVRRSSVPGASGVSRGSSTPSRGAMKKGISEQITDLEATRKDTVAKMTNLVTEKGAGDPGALEGTDAEQYDTYGAEVDEIDTRLKRLQMFERVQTAPQAQPIHARGVGEGREPHRPHIEIRSQLPPGIEFTRYVICKAVAAMSGGAMSAMEVAKSRYPDNPRIQTQIKAAVAGATTTDSTWAGALVDPTNLASEFIEYLRPKTIIGQFGMGSIPSLRRIPFNVRVIGQTTGGAAGWVGQGKLKPVTKFDYSPTALTWAKLAAIAVFGDEVARFSNPGIEGLVRDGLSDVIRERMDIDFIDPAKTASANVSPASITNGATDAGNPAGTSADHARMDAAEMMRTMIALNIVPNAWVMSTSLAVNLSAMTNALGQAEFPGLTPQGGTWMGLPVVLSEYAKTQSSPVSNLLVLLNSQEIFLSDDGGVSIDLSREASIEMSSDPENESGTVVNMFQSNQVALRAERYINWARRRTGSVVYMDGVAYAPSAA